MNPVVIIAGASLTALTIWSCGRLAFARAGSNGLAAPGAIVYGAGAAILSVLVFLLCVLQAANVAVFGAVAAVAIGAWVWICRPTLKRPAFSLWLAPFAIFGAIYFVQALAPEASADGSYYHVAYPAKYLDHGGFYRIVDNMYANLSQGAEMLFLFAFSIGQHSATALVHLTFLVALAAAIVAYGKRFDQPAAGWLAALIVFTAPVVGRDASVAYNDVALACVTFLVFFALELWDRARTSTAWLAVAGLLAGFCYAIKYTGGIAIPFAAAFVLWRGRCPKLAAIVVAAALISVAPWALKNWIWLDNPVSPFFNRVFPNPYVHVSTEEDYTRAMREFGGAPLGLDALIETTIRGGRLQGIVGPVFLLTPVALLGLGDSTGRRLLAAGVIFLLPWFLNIGTRFLIPSLAFFALAIARILTRRGVWPTAILATAQTVVAFPSVVNSYCAPHAWRISDFPWQAALRIVPENEFLDARLDTLPILRMIDANTPPDATIFTALPMPQAYSKRNILLDYTSALSNEVRDLRWAPLRVADQPVAKGVFTFEAQDLNAVRLSVTRECPGNWSIFEAHVPAQSTATSSHDPWKLANATDGNLATRWKLWRKPAPGEWMELRFPSPQRMNELRLDVTGEPANACVKLEGLTASGWRQLAAEPKHDASGIDTLAVRADVTKAVRALGVTHLLIHQDEAQASDFDTNAAAWRVRRIAESGPGRLYELLP